MSSLSLKGRTALVTGAGSGIGQAIAEAMAAEGARVVIAEIRRESGLETVQRIEAAGGWAAVVQVDVTSETDLATAFELFPEVDILVCNAGIKNDRWPRPRPFVAAFRFQFFNSLAARRPLSAACLRAKRSGRIS